MFNRVIKGGNLQSVGDESEQSRQDVLSENTHRNDPYMASELNMDGGSYINGQDSSAADSNRGGGFNRVVRLDKNLLGNINKDSPSMSPGESSYREVPRGTHMTATFSKNERRAPGDNSSGEKQAPRNIPDDWEEE